jgi:Tfp pilus assembly protein PilP
MRLRGLKFGVVLVLLAFALSACGLIGGGNGKKGADDAKKAAEEKLAQLKTAAPQQPGTATTEIKMTTAQQVLDEVGLVHQYDPINKPDPFRPYQPTSAVMTGASDNPLLKYEVRYFKLVGVVRDTENPLAIFEDPSGKSYTVHAGDAIGKNGGIIRAILDDSVVVTETRISWRTDGTETIEMKIRLRTDDNKK